MFIYSTYKRYVFELAYQFPGRQIIFILCISLRRMATLKIEFLHCLGNIQDIAHIHSWSQWLAWLSSWLPGCVYPPTCLDLQLAKIHRSRWWASTLFFFYLLSVWESPPSLLWSPHLGKLVEPSLTLRNWTPWRPPPHSRSGTNRVVTSIPIHCSELLLKFCFTCLPTWIFFQFYIFIFYSFCC